MKGKWIGALGMRVLEGSVSLKDAVSFVIWRFSQNGDIYLNKLRFPNSDHVIWSLITETFFHREYTPPGFDIQNSEIVIDIGAHRGVFTGFAASWSASKIIALEPDIENFSLLIEFILANDLQVDARNYAIAPSDGTIRLFLSESSRHSVTGIDQLTGNQLRKFVEVPCISLDTLISEFEKVDFLKMDCEGAEYGVIEATSLQSLNKIENMSLEIHGTENRSAVAKLMVKLRGSFDVVHVSVKSKTLSIVNARKVHSML